MERVTSLPNVYEESEPNRIIDTSFVLFFLGMEVAIGFSAFSMDSILLVVAMFGVAVLPFFLQGDEEMTFGHWILGRMAIVVFSVFVGALFSKSVGILFPEIFRFAPFTLLILTAMLCCYIQFRNFFEFRIA